MAGQKGLTIDITPDGGVVIEAQGYTGPECRKATEALEKALGKTTGERLTADFHKAPPRVTQKG